MLNLTYHSMLDLIFPCKVEPPTSTILGSYAYLRLMQSLNSREFCKQFSEEKKKVRDHLQVKTKFYDLVMILKVPNPRMVDIGGFTLHILEPNLSYNYVWLDKPIIAILASKDNCDTKY